MDTHSFTALPEDDEKPAKQPGKFQRLVHAFSNRPILPHLHRKEERELIGLVQDADCQDSMERLLQAHMGFVQNISNKYAKCSGMDDHLEDMLEEGCEGFMKSIRKFNLKRNEARLSTLAKYYVVAGCYDYIRTMKYAFRICTNLNDKKAFFGMSRIRAEFFEHYRRNLTAAPNDLEAASLLTGIPTYSLKRAMEIEASGPALCPQSLQIQDMRAQERAEAIVSRKSSAACLERHISRVSDGMTPRDRDILASLMTDCDNRIEILDLCAARHNLSVERIRQIYRGALAQIRESLRDDNLTSMADFG